MLTIQQSHILDLLQIGGPQTDTQLQGNYETWIGPVTPSGLRTRRSELVRKGLVEPTGVSLVTEYGRLARVWKVAR